MTITTTVGHNSHVKAETADTTTNCQDGLKLSQVNTQKTTTQQPICTTQHRILCHYIQHHVKITIFHGISQYCSRPYGTKRDSKAIGSV